MLCGIPLGTGMIGMPLLVLWVIGWCEGQPTLSFQMSDRSDGVEIERKLGGDQTLLQIEELPLGTEDKSLKPATTFEDKLITLDETHSQNKRANNV